MVARSAYYVLPVLTLARNLVVKFANYVIPVRYSKMFINIDRSRCRVPKIVLGNLIYTNVHLDLASTIYIHKHVF